MNLPLDDTNKNLGIINFIETHGPIKNIYDLTTLSDFTAADIQLLKSLIFISVKPDRVQHNLSEKRYDFGNYLTEDGGMSNASQYWLDMIVKPVDINQMNYFDLINLPNLTALDVNAVLKQQSRFPIESEFELKNSPNISSYGLKNLKKFVTYPDEIKKSNPNPWVTRFHIDINTKPGTSGGDTEAVEFENKNTSLPSIYTILRSNFENRFVTGISYFRNMGERQNSSVNELIKNRSLKGNISIEKLDLGKLIVDKLIIGNFSASFGQGVVFVNKDGYGARETGYGWKKRPNGIFPDLSSTTQYVLNGAAVQCSNSLMNFSAFASYSPRDAVINSDGSFSALISLYPRLKWGLSDDSTLFHHPLTNAVNEATYGGHIDIFLLDGLRLGTTIYESLYDRVLNAEIDAILSTIIQDDSKFGDPGLADAEILAMYSSTGKSMLWEDAQSFRRVSGIDFTYILGAMILQGEYGELNKSKSIYHYGDEPAAWVLSSYFSFNKLNLLILYRDYDLDFDNAYQRSFYNYQRFKNTIFSYDYRLNDPIYSYLHLLNPQPQAEKGLFVQSRYEFHRNFLATLEWDSWARVADNARYYRIRSSLKYSPVFNYSFKLNQKFQAKAPFDFFSIKKYYLSETTITAKMRLSNYNDLILTFLLNRFTGAPRPSLAEHYAGSSIEMQVGDAGSPESAFGVTFSHHLDAKSTISGTMYMIDGYFINTTSGDFRIFSGENQVLYSSLITDLWISHTLKLKFRVSHTSDPLLTNAVGVYPAGSADVESEVINFPTIYKSSTDFTFNLDYVF